MTRSTIVTRPAHEPFARHNGGIITVGQFNADVLACAQMLPATANIINLVADRYAFTVSFFAALTRGQTNLLPASRDLVSARLLANQTGDCSVIADGEPANRTTQSTECAPDCVLSISPAGAGSAASVDIPDAQLAAIAYTSGSTGVPQPHHKTWGMLAQWRHVHWRHLPGDQSTPRSMVATVPSWHMYGLEWVMLLPTVAPITVHHGPAFYPRDVISAVEECTGETVLISTPVHLRALTRATAAHLAGVTVISATAPLDPVLAETIESQLHASVFEIYGCSEVGSLAWRAPLKDAAWRFFDCFDLHFDQGEISIEHPALHHKVTLADRFEALGENKYGLVGRASDIVKVGGKRASLANLNTTLTSLEGVVDGVFYQPQDFDLPGDRLAAVAVAPGLTTQQIRAMLARKLDSAFVPRPIYLVSELPRDATSKLKQRNFAQLLRSLT